MKRAYILIAVILLGIFSYVVYQYSYFAYDEINGFVILEQKDFMDQKGWLHITGKVKNIEQPDDNTKIVVEYYNKENQTVGKTVYYFDENISKGEVKDYDVFKVDNLDQVDSYKFTIER